MAEYAAGRMAAQQLVGVVAAAYYKGEGRGERLRPVMDVIERAHPGVIELAATNEKPGFAVRLAERPFPKRYEAELRQAVEGLVLTGPRSPLPGPGLFARILRAIRKVFGKS